MHEDDSAGGGSLNPPAGPSDDIAPPGRLRTRAPGWARGWLIHLVVAALAAGARVGATLTVQHATSSRPAAARGPRDAAADRHRRAPAMNREAVYKAVQPGIPDVPANLRDLQETAEGTSLG